MAANLKVKLLQHLAKKNANEGFTLVELLVVVVIIGILAAIALPSFLAQTAKAKQSEARTYLGSWAKAQKAFRTENSIFADKWTTLSLGLGTESKNYTYDNVLNEATDVDGFAISKAADLKSYAAKVIVLEKTITVDAKGKATEIAVDMPDALCESINPGDAGKSVKVASIDPKTSVVTCTNGIDFRTGK